MHLLVCSRVCVIKLYHFYESRFQLCPLVEITVLNSAFTSLSRFLSHKEKWVKSSENYCVLCGRNLNKTLSYKMQHLFNSIIFVFIHFLWRRVIVKLKMRKITLWWTRRLSWKYVILGYVCSVTCNEIILLMDIFMVLDERVSAPVLSLF